MKIKKFNSAGHEKWSSFYNEVKYEIDQVAKSPKISPQDILAGYNDTLKEKYKILKNSDDISEELVSSKEFKIKKFNNSYELASCINQCLSNYKFYEIDISEIWDWLAMMLFDQIFVPGKIRGAAKYRYVVDIDDFFTSFRHMIRGPCWTVNQFGENARLFTHTPTYQQNDWLEQFIKVSFLREMKVMGEVCMKLYYNYKDNEAIPGTSKAPARDPDRPGIFPRLRNKLSQFNKVKYIWDMNSSEVIKMLPKEFDKYKKNITL